MSFGTKIRSNVNQSKINSKSIQTNPMTYVFQIQYVISIIKNLWNLMNQFFFMQILVLLNDVFTLDLMRIYALKFLFTTTFLQGNKTWREILNVDFSYLITASCLFPGKFLHVFFFSLFWTFLWKIIRALQFGKIISNWIFMQNWKSRPDKDSWNLRPTFLHILSTYLGPI